MIEYSNDQSKMIELFKKRGILIAKMEDDKEIEKIDK
jgi:hypothetical protein